MYKDMLVACIKVNDRILRENKDTVHIPFGSEYSILLQNKNTVRAQVKITIDETDVLNGSSIIVEPNSELNLERYLKDLDKGNKFKFIEFTDKIEENRGIKGSDGLIRIEFQFEKLWDFRSKYAINSNITLSDGVGSINCNLSTNTMGNIRNFSNSVTNTCASVAPSDLGITVPGSISDQQFKTVHGFPLEKEKHVIVFKLLGKTADDKVVEEAVTVKHKPKCVTCGRINKASSKFCTECGTSLNIV